MIFLKLQKISLIKKRKRNKLKCSYVKLSKFIKIKTKKGKKKSYTRYDPDNRLYGLIQMETE